MILDTSSPPIDHLGMTKSFALYVFVFGEFDDVIAFDTRQEAYSYTNGVMYGLAAGNIDGDSVRFYILPGDEEKLNKTEKASAIEKAFKEWTPDKALLTAPSIQKCWCGLDTIPGNKYCYSHEKCAACGRPAHEKSCL